MVMYAPTYRILTATSIQSLEPQLNDALRDGWLPVGGLAIWPPSLLQAIIRVGSSDEQRAYLLRTLDAKTQELNEVSQALAATQLLLSHSEGIRSSQPIDPTPTTQSPPQELETLRQQLQTLTSQNQSLLKTIQHLQTSNTNLQTTLEAATQRLHAQTEKQKPTPLKVKILKDDTNGNIIWKVLFALRSYGVQAEEINTLRGKLNNAESKEQILRLLAEHGVEAVVQ
jgi:regulator of replication initiation timing